MLMKIKSSYPIPPEVLDQIIYMHIVKNGYKASQFRFGKDTAIVMKYIYLKEQERLAKLPSNIEIADPFT